MSPFSRGTGPQGDPLAGNHILVRIGERVSRRETPVVLGTVLVVSLLGFAVLPRVPFGPSTPPARTEAQARQRQGQMARLPQWRELRRQARARGVADSAVASAGPSRTAAAPAPSPDELPR